MLRLIFVFGIVLIGAIASLQGPFYVLLFYLWNAYFRPEYWVWDDILFSFRLSLVIGLALIASSIGLLNEFRWNRLSTLVAAFFAQATLSLVTSRYTGLSLDFWIEFTKVILVAAVMTVLVTDRWRFRLVLWVIAWSLAFEPAKQGWATLVLNPGASNINPHVMLGDNNGVALGMMMLVPMLMALAQTSETLIERYIHYFVLIGVTYRGISTYSRGGFVAGAVVFLLTLWRSQHRIRTLIGTALVASTLLSVMPDTFWSRMQTISASTEDDGRDVSAQARLDFWTIAVRMAEDHPLTGVGFNGFRFALPAYDSKDEGMRAVHSVWFGVLADLGFPGLLLFAAIAVGALFSCQQIRTEAMRSKTKDMAIYASHLQTAVAVYCVGGAFLSVHYLELWWHLVALVITLGLVFERVGQTSDAPMPVLQPIAVPSAPLIPARLRRQ